MTSKPIDDDKRDVPIMTWGSGNWSQKWTGSRKPDADDRRPR